MENAPVRSLRDFLDLLRARGELLEVETEVDPRFEVAEVHRRVIAAGGPALLFRRCKGAAFPLVTNLFGTTERASLAFGTRPRRFVERVVETAHTLLPPTFRKLWAARGLAFEGLRVGMRSLRAGPVTEVEEAPDLGRMPALTSWRGDGGPFLTLPLVHTEHPTSGKPNLGIYRMHVHGKASTGMHFQIHKGGGFHFHEAERLGQDLPATVFLGGPPAMVIAAIAPLPEDVPELLLASLLLGERLPRVKGRSAHPLVAQAEFALCGRVARGERRPEGPFGDHFGYDSLAHDYPVFHVDRVFRRRDAIFPATVVGRPRQEDFYIGDWLQDLLSPLFPLVMPAVRDIWAFGETGFHSLAVARVKRERYPREALAHGMRILGEGQLSLTKVLIVVDDDAVAIRDVRALLPHVLARMDWRTDAVVLGETAQDTLDYTGPTVNRGSKAILLATGPARRSLPTSFHGDLPAGVARAVPFVPGALVVEGVSFADERGQAERVARHAAFAEWPLLVLVDDAEEASRSPELFLWTTFTRMEPAADLHGRERVTARFHTGLLAPVVVDARMKPGYPRVMEVDPETRALVDRRWDEYGIRLR
ncbi:MAG TPA: UbiD family decarboxylase [Planctomycetota bacterium]|nr:UbiD family decarboxylase [Planctomycetota bacterium]